LYFENGEGLPHNPLVARNLQFKTPKGDPAMIAGDPIRPKNKVVVPDEDSPKTY
jgi:hypothetical protein